MADKIGRFITKAAAVTALVSSASLDSDWKGVYIIAGVSLLVALAGMVKFYTGREEA